MQTFSDGDGGQGWNATCAPNQQVSSGEPPDSGHGSPPRPERFGEPKPGFIMRHWTVSVLWASGTTTTSSVIAPTRGKAMADTWRSDAFNSVSFGEFLRFARCWRDRYTPPRWGDPITVNGKPAFFVGNNRQYVQFVYPGGTFTLNAHPYDVLPVEYRPWTYRDRDRHPEGDETQSGSVERSEIEPGPKASHESQPLPLSASFGGGRNE